MPCSNFPFFFFCPFIPFVLLSIHHIERPKKEQIYYLLLLLLLLSGNKRELIIFLFSSDKQIFVLFSYEKV